MATNAVDAKTEELVRLTVSQTVESFCDGTCLSDYPGKWSLELGPGLSPAQTPQDLIDRLTEELLALPVFREQ